MTEVEHINKYLKQQERSIDNKVLYRIVWSEKTFEHRCGMFRDFTESGLFIREVTETRLVKKYNYIKERFILEKWAPGNLTSHKETPDAISGDYIPVYVFESGDGKYLSPTLKVVQFIIDFMRGNVKKDTVPSQEYLDMREVSSIEDSLDDHPGYFKTSGPSRNAIAYDKGLKGL